MRRREASGSWDLERAPCYAPQQRDKADVREACASSRESRARGAGAGRGRRDRTPMVDAAERHDAVGLVATAEGARH
jgi:hypothetical protein